MTGRIWRQKFCLWRFLHLFLWIVPSPWLTHCLRITETIIPDYGVLNSNAALLCFFDPENSTLFSVKWYKDGHEFFRYKPKEDPPIKVFPLSGVTVNENRSSLNQVSLEPITLLSKGVYRCEVSADAPSFQTLYDERQMDVMVLPRKGPQLSGIHPWYNIGDNFSAKCSVEKAFPQPKLLWFINDIQLDSDACDCISTETFENGKAIDGTIFYSSTTQIDFQLDTLYFRDGSLIVECKAIFTNSPIVLRIKSQSNIKAGFGRHYANIFSRASINKRWIITFDHVILIVSMLILYL